MLNCSDLLTCDTFIPLSDISLELYRDFGRSILLKRRFHYYFDDNSECVIEFQEYGIRHMLGIHHIDGNIKKNDFFSEIDSGLTLSSFTSANSIRNRFKKMKPRIRLFACTYNTLRCGRVFYCPNREVRNSNTVKMDYIIFREIDSKGFNIGIRNENGCYTPLTILVANEKCKDKYIDKSQIKIVSRLLITDLYSGNTIEDIVYSDSFMFSAGAK